MGGGGSITINHIFSWVRSRYERPSSITTCEKRRIQNYWPILMKERGRVPGARDQFDGRRLDVARKGPTDD